MRTYDDWKTATPPEYSEPSPKPGECPECRGVGRVWNARNACEATCLECRGTGEDPATVARCPDCGADVESIFDHVDGCPPEEDPNGAFPACEGDER